MSINVFGVRITTTTARERDTTIGLSAELYVVTSAVSAGATEIPLTDGDAPITALMKNQWVGDVYGTLIGCIKQVNAASITLYDPLSVALDIDAQIIGYGEFRWVQSSMDAFPYWYGGRLVKGGLDPWTRQIDLRFGGNVENNPASQVTVINTDKFHQTLETLGVNLIGCRAEIWHFDGTTGTCKHVFQCQEPSMTSTEFTIPLLGMQERRNAIISPLVTKTTHPNATTDAIGTRLPVSFGYMPKRKLVKVTKLEKLLTASDIVPSFTPANTVQFPVISAIPGVLTTTEATLSYQIQISRTRGYGYDNNLVGKFVRVVAGSKSVGQMRRIASNTYNHSGFDSRSTTVVLDAYFTESLVGSYGAMDSNNSWVEIVDVAGTFECDSFPCKSFVDSNGSDITNGVELFAFGGDDTVKIALEDDVVPVRKEVQQYFPLPQYIYDRSADAENNSVDIDAKQFSSSPDQADAFKIIPLIASDIALVPTAVEFDLLWPDNPYGTAARYADGLFAESGGISGVNGVTAGDFGRAVDKNSTTSTLVEWECGTLKTNSPQFITQAIKFKLPPAPENFIFDEVYLLVRAKNTILCSSTELFNASIYAGYNKFLGPSYEIVHEEFNFGDALLDINDDIVVANDSPDFYYSNPPDNKNKFFYATSKVIASPTSELYGKSYWKLPNVVDKKSYDAIYEVMLAISTQISTGGGEVNATLWGEYHELAVMFHKSASIGEATYSPHKGRIYNNSFEGRRTPTDMINGPSNVLEHIARLQNYSDISRGSATYNWGTTYAGAAQICTLADAEGSFDAEEITVDLSFASGISNELMDEAEMQTAEVKKSICRNFLYGSFENAEGLECVKKVKRSATSPSETITLDDIMDRRAIRLEYPQVSNIFAEPFVRYGKNLGSGSMDSIIKFTNASAATFSDSYVQAADGVFGAGEKQYYWDKCAALWSKCKQINTPPTELTEFQWANTGDSSADSVAKEYITSWIDVQFNPIISFPVHMLTVRDLELMHRFNLQLPHHTNNAIVECVLTKITINPNSPYTAEVQAMVYSETIPADFYWQNSYSDSVPVYENTYSDGELFENVS